MTPTRLLGQFIAIVLAALLSSCTTQLPQGDKPISYFIAAPSDTPLAKVIESHTSAHPGQSGAYPLSDGVDAFVARLALIKSAQYSVDVQYYIYRGGETGKLLTWTLLEAAERGVRVRLLLDDMNTSGKDQTIRTLSEHPNINIRLFNPFTKRQWRGLEFLGNFSRANRRMHNKSLTVDNLATVVGGRNIGDEYFSANDSLSFSDFDILAIGPVVEEISQQFDLYWNNSSAHAVEVLVDHTINAEQWSRAKSEFAADIQTYHDSAYVKKLKNADIINDLSGDHWPLFWGQASALFDKPNKISQTPHYQKNVTLEDLSSDYMLKELAAVFGKARDKLTLISPYFVPGDSGVEQLIEYANAGIEVTVVTNSLAATDVVAVHSGYAAYRRPLLEAGVTLYEARVDANQKPGSWKGSSRASLHAKTFYLDDSTVFVGSFNLDPRSAMLNTELGIVIQSPELAKILDEGISSHISQVAYRVALSDSGKLVWHDDATQTTLHTEPNASIWRRSGAWLLSWLPIERQL